MAVAERALRELVDGPRDEDFHAVHARLLAELKDAADNYLAVAAILAILLPLHFQSSPLPAAKKA